MSRDAVSRAAVITCPVCHEKLPNTWGAHVPKPKRGDIIECGLCSSNFRYGPPHSVLVQMRVYPQADSTVKLRLTEGKTMIDWVIGHANAREFAAALVEVAEIAGNQ